MYHKKKYRNKSFFCFLCFNWDSLHARVKSHFETLSYKKKKRRKRLRANKKICLERTQREKGSAKSRLKAT